VRIEKLKHNLDIEVQWVYFPLHPDTPPDGLSLKDLFAGRGFDLEAMHARMKGLMDMEGLPYERRTHTYNSRLAQELAKWADSQPGFEAIHQALYRAYFVEGRNIGDVDVLMDIAGSVGLPEGQARTVLVERTFRELVDQDWQMARQYGITGVPSFVAGGTKVVGAQPYEVLVQQLRAAGAQPR
jgi:predicted DsbA family dithiol-disulfide isomerase